jgi:Rod binding domain-containing protein
VATGAAAISTVTAGSATGTTAVSPRLTQAAHEFEAMMMKELLKPMTSSQDDDADSGDTTLGSGSALGEFASEALGKALSQHGGFGMANRIIGDLSHSGNASVIGQVTTNLHTDTVIRTPQ